MNFLEDIKTVAIIGLSRDTSKSSHQVAAFLQKQGVKVVPINPQVTVLLKEKSYKSIADVPEDITIDVIAIYRKSEVMLETVREIIKKRNVKTLWIPQGAENIEAEKEAFHHGITVITNFCLLHEYKSLTGKKRLFEP